ncbi:MAG: hypothetical protein OXR62_14125 [Ahrensia sp.]|nr:hypothetical protein [Ahrensia sp.]
MSEAAPKPNNPVSRAIVNALSWVDDKAKVKRFFWGLVVAGAVLTLLDLFHHKHSYFDAEHWFGFYSFYGFIMCALLVIAARGMRVLLMRDEDYYGRADIEAEDHPAPDLERRELSGTSDDV